MTDLDTFVLSGSHRSPITVQKREGGGITLRSGRSHIRMADDEVVRLLEFVEQQDQPALGHMQVFTA
jgi:hypothetical protein